MTSFLVKTAAEVDREVAALHGRRLIVSMEGRAPFDSEASTGIIRSGQYQWCQRDLSWFGPAYAVSWKAGDSVGHPVGPWPGLGHGVIQGSNSNGSEPPQAADNDITGVPQFDFDDNSTHDTPAASDGSGIIFFIQTSGNPPTSAIPPLDLNVLDYLGALQLTNGTTVVPYALDPGDGDDGDAFLDWTSRNLYQRDAGAWGLLGNIADPQQQFFISSSSAGTPAIQAGGGPGSGADPINDAPLLRLYADTGIGSYPNAGLDVDPHGTLLVMGAQPDDSRLVPGRMAVWFDPTPGAAKLMIRAKDSAGTIVSGNLPLT